MIDTIKIYTEIDKETHSKIKSKSIIKSSIDNNTNKIIYEITNDHLKGSFDSRLSVRTDCGSKYGFVNEGYYIEIEGSYHKLIMGYNSHNGYYDLLFIAENLIRIVELDYNLELPKLEKWYLQRCDVAICYDLQNQENVKSYINSLSRCTYPRRNAKFFYDESLKQLNGLIRFECEIKKKMLKRKFNNEKHIKVKDVNYEDLKNIWSEEFMKLLQFIKNDLEIVRGREAVYKRLNEVYKNSKAN